MLSVAKQSSSGGYVPTAPLPSREGKQANRDSKFNNIIDFKTDLN